MSKLTIDDLVAAQQRTEAALQDIANSLRSAKKPTKKESATNALSSLVSVVVWGIGAAIAYNGNMIGACICMIAISARIERLLHR